MMHASGGPLAPLRALLGSETLGGEQLLTAAADIAPFLTDHRKLYQGKALAVVQPRDTATLCKVLALCNTLRIGVVPQGGNTSYCGGATPDSTGSQIVISMRHMDRVRSVDAANFSITVEAGCILANVQAAASATQRFFPLSLGAAGSCQIGGNLGTNAGGLNVVRYGMTRDLVLGLEVALPDGRLLSTLSGLRKDNTGYDLKSLFVGSEGTLGVITAATLKLFPKPVTSATAFVALDSPAAAVELLNQVRSNTGDAVSSFELIPRIGVELTTEHIDGVRDPLEAPSPWYVLCELTSANPEANLDDLLQRSLAAALTRGLISNAVIAKSERETAALWRLRESIPEAQRRDGASLKHDVSLPITALPEFVARGAAWLDANIPEGRLVAYGHVGDGNLHFNVNQRKDMAAAQLLAREGEVRRALHDLVRDLGGSFSAEHGIGQSKVGELERYASPVELELMRNIKRSFDPNGIMNPGKVLRA